jgi:hypothetical protein
MEEEGKPSNTNHARRPWLSMATIRDAAFILIGLAGLIHETFFVQGQRYVLLAIFATMLGLPGALQLDRTLQIRIGSRERGG